MARRKEPRIPDHLLDQLLAGTEAKSAFAKNGLLNELKKALAEQALNAEIDHHLEQENGGSNACIDSGRKNVLTDTGKIDLGIPAQSPSDVCSPAVAKCQQRFPGFDEKIASIYAWGMSLREIQGHLRDLYCIEVSPDLVSAVTDAVLEEISKW